MKRAVFLDKDGTLIRDVPYRADPDDVELYPHVPESLNALRRAGYFLVLVSNQPGLALGCFDEATLGAHLRTLGERLAQQGVEPIPFYYCPHDTGGSVERYARACECRKPSPGLLRRAAEEHGIDLRQSWVVGDRLHDVEAGHRVGCRAILVDTGNETEWREAAGRTPDIRVDSFLQAARALLEADGAAVTLPGASPGLRPADEPPRRRRAG